MEPNGGAPKMRVDFSIRIVADANTYTSVGQMMDSLAGVIADIVEGRGRFDFVHFQTHPCKASRMEHMAMLAQEVSEPAIPGSSPDEF